MYASYVSNQYAELRNIPAAMLRIHNMSLMKFPTDVPSILYVPGVAACTHNERWFYTSSITAAGCQLGHQTELLPSYGPSWLNGSLH